MSVWLKNTTEDDLEIDDGEGGRVTIAPGDTFIYPIDIASTEVRALLADGSLIIEDEPPGLELPPEMA